MYILLFLCVSILSGTRVLPLEQLSSVQAAPVRITWWAYPKQLNENSGGRAQALVSLKSSPGNFHMCPAMRHCLTSTECRADVKVWPCAQSNFPNIFPLKDSTTTVSSGC